MMERLKESRWLYILVSVLIAVAFWLYIRNVQNTASDYTIYNVPVQITNSRVLNERGLTVASLSQDTVNVTVNALLRAVEPLLPEAPPPSFTVVDCGCGKAYLTLALQRFLTLAKGWPDVRVLGIDRNPDVVAAARAQAQALGVEGAVSFQAAEIAAADWPKAPDLVMSLHACDTATDDALIAAVRSGAARILCVPCCQHELHHALTGGGPMRAVLRHGILRERLADLLTDTFRAQALRVCGYRARVMEFVSPEATGRNLLIRAERGLRPGLGEAVAEYRALCDFWGVRPYIGRLVADDAP